MKHGWDYKKLGELVQVLNGYAFKSSLYENQGIRVLRITNVQKGNIVDDDPKYYPLSLTDEIRNYLLKENDLLMSLTGNVGRVGLLTKEMLPAALNQRVACLRILSNGLNLGFLFHYLNSDKFEQDAVLSAKGIAQKNMSTEWLKDYKLPLPPISVQQSIVSELEKINELIRLKKEQQKDYDNLAQSIFYEMFGDPVVNEKGWEVKKLGEVCTYPNKRISLSDITSYEYVGVETLVKNKGGVLFTEELPNAKNAIEYIENDILIGNIRPYLKKIWKSDRHGGASGDVVIIRISDSMKGLLTPVYLFKLLSTDEFFEYDNANTHGAKMPRGDRKAIAEFTIQIPPMDIQHIFAQRIELIEKQKAEIQSTIADLETLLASRMQYWFG